MMSLLVFFVDAPQHLRIVEAALRFVAKDQRVVMLSTVGAGDLTTREPRLECIDIAVQPHGSRARMLHILTTGLRVSATALSYLRRLEPLHDSRHFVVLGDTGVPHRRLLSQANRSGWNTVLVQDGLVEVGFRESGHGFRWRRAFTDTVLRPLGLQWLGTTPYGAGGARRILVDGEAAASFFRRRCSSAEIIVGGLLRPTTRADGHVNSCVLFWAVDFLGGLNNPLLHERQLTRIIELDRKLTCSDGGINLVVRLHPRDLPFVDCFRTALRGCRITTLQLPSEHADPFEHGLPLATCSLQSAGVFDALALGIPSLFLDDGQGFLGPGWVPGPLRLDIHALTDWLQEVAAGPSHREATWQTQSRSLAPSLLVPPDPHRVRAAWTTP